MANTPSRIEKRRSVRVPRTLRIRVSGKDANGKGFLAPSQALVLSRYGAEIFLTQQLIPEQEITLHHPGTGKDEKARVVGLFTSTQRGYTYGIEFLDKGANFWEAEFPPFPDPDVKSKL